MHAAALALFLSLMFASTVLAQDACLSGASTLGDQRALAALRAVTEAQCPCASFSSRGKYQKCAREVAETALDAADLRPECSKTAKAMRKGATCGTSKIACGRYKPLDDEPLSCRVKKPESCTDRTRYEQNPCSAETHCADVIDWTATTCVDVHAKGPFEAGARVLTFTKDSVVSPGTPRVLDTVVWYPTTPGAVPIDSQYGAVLDAPLDLSGGPYPVLLFSHGSCGYPLQSIFMTPLIASHGFIVVAPPHPGNTLFEFPSCGTPAAQVNSFQERPQDMIFVLDEMLDESLDPLSPFFDALDPDRVGMSGHSFGGLTTYLVTPLDARIKVAMPLAAAVLGSPILGVPSLNMLGQIDSVVNNDGIRTAYANAQPPKYLVEIANAGHYAFSNACFPSADCAPPVTLTQVEAHEVVLRWVVPFLQRHLAGDESFAPFFVAPPPGVVVELESAP